MTKGRAALWLGVAALGLVLAGDATASPNEKKLDRQIDLFERIVDDMLVESPNWLVQSSRETRGRYRAGTGARFTFDVSLVGRNHWGGGSKWWKTWMHHDGDVIVIDVDDYDDLDAEEIEALVKSEKKSRERYRERSVEKQTRLYDRGKVEILEMILDFGDVLTTVPDGETLVLVAYLDDSEIFYEKDLRTLTVTAKMSDVRAFGNGKIDEKTMIGRIQVEES